MWICPVGLAAVVMVILLGSWAVCGSMRLGSADLRGEISELLRSLVTRIGNLEIRVSDLGTPIREEERRQAMLEGIENVRR